MVKKINLAAIAAAGALNMAAPATDANAALIYTAEGEFLVGGESLSPSMYRSSMDENKINFEFDSNYLLSNFRIPFNTREAAEMLDITLRDNLGNILTDTNSNNFYGCNASNGVLTCGSRNPVENIFGVIELKEEFKDTYKMDGFNLDVERLTNLLSTNFRDIEYFPMDGKGPFYNVSQRVTQQDPVNASAPGTLGLLVGAGALALLRRKEKPQVDSKYNQF